MNRFTLRNACLWCWLFVSALLSSSGLAQSDYLQQSEKEAKAILEKTIQTLGGRNYLQVQDITVSGRYYEFRRDELQGTTLFESYTKFPHKFRNEIGKGRDVIIINDGEKGWKIEYKNLSEQSPEEIKNFLKNTSHNLDYVLRYRLKEEGMRFRYAGRSRIDLEEVDEVELISKDNDRVRILLSTSTSLPLKAEYQSPGIGKRWATEDEKFFYNYHDIKGVQIPFKTVRMANGFKASEVHLESARLDWGLPDELFTPTFKGKIK